MRVRMLAFAVAAACGSTHPRLSSPVELPPMVTAPDGEVAWHGGPAPLSIAAEGSMVAVPTSRSVAGSTPEERGTAYDDYRVTSGNDTARDKQWFETEEDRHVVEVPGFVIDLMPVTNAAYAEFVADGGAPPPAMDEATWKQQGFVQKWPDEVERYVWVDGRPPSGREDHPVVLVTWDQAAAYCAWRGQVIHKPRRLPSAHELEKAARGDEGLPYPWGLTFDAKKLNSAVGGPHDTVPVGSFADAASPYGVLDTAGNVFQWTSTPWPVPAPGAAAGHPARMTVKGSAWDDFGGVGRGASWHGRPRTARHVIVGFRCAGPLEAKP